jgi:CRP/FNR family transcriptional regulator, anaerobic regulatory protein
VRSFLRQRPSVDSIVALEDCECWGITHAELEEVYRLYPEFNLHGRIITGEYYCRSEERHEFKHNRTPEYRYEHIMTTEPELVARVPRKYLASYLSVSLRTLGSIKSSFTKRKKR